MKKMISMFAIVVFLTSAGLVAAQTQEAKKEVKEAKKTTQMHNTVKKAKKSCETCTDKTKCAVEKKAEVKAETK